MKEEEVMKEMEGLDQKLREKYPMYADLDFQRKMKLMKGNTKNIAKEMDKEKLKQLISEYKKFKMENVRHFRFHPNASTTIAFGKLFL